MQKLSITLNDVETELKENREKVKILTENNDALSIKVKSLEKKIDKQEDEIDDLKEKNSKFNLLKLVTELLEELFNFIASVSISLKVFSMLSIVILYVLQSSSLL